MCAPAAVLPLVSTRSLARALVLFAVLAALCLVVGRPAGAETTAETTALTTTAEVALPTVSKLRFEGVDALDKSLLRERMITTGPDWRPWRAHPPFEADELAEDIERIRTAYREHGYYEARAEVDLTWNDDGTSVEILVRVTEGEPIRLLDWQLELSPSDADSNSNSDSGLTPAELALLRERLPEIGSVFGVDVYRAVRTATLDHLGDLGHPAASLEGGADVDRLSRLADVSWVLHLGPDVRIGNITLVGLEEVEAHVVQRELRFAAGERLSRLDLRTSQRRLFATGLFRSVSIQPLEHEAVPIDVRLPESEPESELASVRETVLWPIEVRVKERSPRTFNVGVGYGTEDEFRARAGWTHRNFLGDARQLSVGGKYSSILSGGEVSVLQRYLFDVPLRSELRLSAFQDTPRAYSANRFSEDLSFDRSLGHGFSLQFGQRFEWADVTDQRDEDSDKDPGDDDVDLPEKVTLHTFPLGLRHSTLDDPINPTRGTWLELSLEPSWISLGSDVDYVKLTAEARGFLPILATVLATRFRIGTLEPYADSGRDDVPVFKRFYSGGSTSVRGFSYQKLGPHDDSGDPLGGLSFAEASIELRFPIWRKLSGVVFSDAGQVSLPPLHWSTHDIFYSSGVGLRLGTPVGPIRVDVARIYNPPNDIDPIGFYISVGQAF